MTTAPSASTRPASSTYGLSDSPGSSSSLFLSLSGAASPYSSSVSCGNYSLSNSNLPESPCYKQLTLYHQQQQQQQQCQQQFNIELEDWQSHFLQFQQQNPNQHVQSCYQAPSQQQVLQVCGGQNDPTIWGCMDELAQPEDHPDSPDKERQQQQPLASFESYNDLPNNCGFTVRPQTLTECRGDSLHNRIFERGENYFGFSAEDRQLLESAILPDTQPAGSDSPPAEAAAAATASPNPLLTHFPRRKLDADLRVPATVYLEDKSGKRHLNLDISSEVPVSKLLIRCQAIGLLPGDYPQPCSTCSVSNGQLLVSIASHSLEGLVHLDPDRQQSCLYCTGLPEAGRMWLTLRYNCCQDHMRNNQRLSHLALANLITVIEAFDQLGCLIGRASFRVRVVASPARDLLRFLTSQLTPVQTGCTIGQCTHLAARWKAERFRQLPAADLGWCLRQLRFKESLRAELEAQLEQPQPTATKRQRQESDLNPLSEDEPQPSSPEGLQILPDGSMLVRSSDGAKMARIRDAINAILASESGAEKSVAVRPTLNLRPMQQAAQPVQQVIHAAPPTFQPILLIRPYCQFK
ncbi:hypothetical protein BOX15_Mlig020042g1 [Macrostomum lignano]|uniref:Uncharacterized protein n=1 Tax=Macrostomum lignano TaxID=282301 RepID=A0A267EKK1_9PLAT|nr:hypothetical protein BOX15_Mlig020042g1 [Macrostomum lignano]